MRGITPPSSRPHRRCRQNQQIQSLAFANLTRCNEHYRWHHWSIATSCDLLLPHRQRRHLPLPPSDDNQDDVDDEDDDSDYDKDDEDNEDDNNDDDNDNDNDDNNDKDDDNKDHDDDNGG